MRGKRKYAIDQEKAHMEYSYLINMYEFQRSNCTNFHVEMVKVKEGINGWINEKGEGMA